MFAATGGMGPTATTVFRKFASMLAEKHSTKYSKCLFWLRCSVCFSLLRSAVVCLRVIALQLAVHPLLILIWPTPRVAWNLAALFDCWYFQLSCTLTHSAGGGGKSSPSSPGKKLILQL